MRYCEKQRDKISGGKGSLTLEFDIPSVNRKEACYPIKLVLRVYLHTGILTVVAVASSSRRLNGDGVSLRIIFHKRQLFISQAVAKQRRVADIAKISLRVAPSPSSTSPFTYLFTFSPLNSPCLLFVVFVKSRHRQAGLSLLVQPSPLLFDFQLSRARVLLFPRRAHSLFLSGGLQRVSDFIKDFFAT